MILRASRPPPTSSAPAPSAKSAGAPIPPLAGSCFAGAGAGAGAAFGGGGGGAALGGGGGAALGGGGSGSHGALATTPPALASITPSLHSASAFAPPAPAMFSLASATTAGSSWARAGEAASRATATIAASIINFLKPTYLLVKQRVCSFLIRGGPSEKKDPPPSRAIALLYVSDCYLPEADAAWLTCWSQVVEFSGLISIEEPTSSNSNSSAVEPYWRISIRFWVLPVLPTP